jgi:hypothetical protein
VARAAVICSCSRDAIRRKIGLAAIAPVDTDSRGHPLYRVLDVCLAFAGRPAESPKVRDPDLMSPAELNSYYQAEQKRLDLEERAGRLVPAEEVESSMSRLFGELAVFLDSMPDELERDHGLPPEAVTDMRKRVRDMRLRLYESIVERIAKETHEG